MESEVNEIVAQVPGFGGKGVFVERLEGGFTNRNYRLQAGDETFVLRIAGADTALLGIDRQTEFACTQLASAAGVGPEVIACIPEHSALIRRFVHGRLLTSEDIRRPDITSRIAQSLRRFHDFP